MSITRDTLIEIASTVTVVVEFDKDRLGKRVHNAVTKALKQGYIATRSGMAAKYHGLIADHLGMPTMRFSRASSYWDGVAIHRLPEGCAEPLHELWTADRVLFRLEHPEEWQKAVTPGTFSHLRDAITEPDLKYLVANSHNGHAYMRLLGTKDAMYFDKIAAQYINSPNYKIKLDQALELLNGGGSMTIELKG